MSSNHLFNRATVGGNYSDGDFTIATYNVLADYHIPNHSLYQKPETTPKLYRYCPPDHLYKKIHGRKSSRHLLLINELLYLSADILCLQEIDDWYYPQIMKDELHRLGYESFYQRKEKNTEEGLLTAFRKDQFSLVEHQVISLNDLMYEKADELGIEKGDIGHFERDSVAIVMKLVHLKTLRKLFVCNFHAFYDYAMPDVTTLQISLLAEKLKLIQSQGLKEAACRKIPLIYCGDFNMEKQQHGYKVIVNGKLNRDEIQRLSRIRYQIDPASRMSIEKEKFEDPKSTASIFKDAFSHDFPLKSAYKESMGQEPGITSDDGVHQGSFDYIFFSDELMPTGVLAPFTAEEFASNGPSHLFPSDHTSLKAKFKFLQ